MQRKKAICQMFITKLKLAADCLLNWFNKKIKSKNLELDMFQRTKYEKTHPIDWEKDSCCIFNFPLQINIKGLEATETQMSYTDFYIRKEHKFLRNIFPKEDLKKSETLKDLPTYYKVFKNF